MTDKQDEITPTTEWTPVGKFGFTLTEGGDLKYQFRVAGQVGADRYAVELFSWFSGELTETRIWAIDDLMNCPLFVSQADWMAAAERRADRC